MTEKTKEPESQLKDYRSSGRLRGMVDIPFLMLVLLLLLIGTIAVLSASYTRALYSTGDSTYYFTRQLMMAGLGLGAMVAVCLLPMGFWKGFSGWAFLIAIGFLILVKVAGVSANGAKRWFSIAGVTFQPSELAKFAVIVLEARLICNYGRKRMETFRYGVVPFAAIVAVIDGLLMLEPHMSASLIIAFITIILMWCGGTQKRWFVLAILVGGGLLGLYLLVSNSYQSDRIVAWLDPFGSTTEKGYQIVQSLYAVASGGLTGLGLGNSRQKAFYLPEEHNDYIFAVWCEEAGFIGAILVLILFALLICRGYWLALHSRDRYSFLVCVGVISLLAIQVILNIAVVTNLLPSTGISLPFFSYGGTALIIQMAEMGLVLNASRDIPHERMGRKKRGEITSIHGDPAPEGPEDKGGENP